MLQQADHFLIPLLDGHFGVAQVIEVVDGGEGSVICALTRRRRKAKDPTVPLTSLEVVAVLKVQPPEDQPAVWPIIGFEQIPPIRHIWPLQEHRKNDFSDVPLIDAAIVEAFVNACHGLYPWDGFPDPDFFTHLLLRPDIVLYGRLYKEDATA